MEMSTDYSAHKWTQVYVNLIYDKSDISNQWGNNGGGSQMSSHLEHIKLNLYHTVYLEIDCRCIKDFNAEI